MRDRCVNPDIDAAIGMAEDNTTAIGLNPDIARLVAKKLDLKLKFVDTKFDTIVF